MTRMASVEVPTCLATGLPLPYWSTYRRHTVEVLEVQVDVEPNGYGHGHTLRAGTFCSDRCAMAWLARSSGEWRDYALVELEDLLGKALCRVAAEDRPPTGDGEPF